MNTKRRTTAGQLYFLKTRTAAYIPTVKTRWAQINLARLRVMPFKAHNKPRPTENA